MIKFKIAIMFCLISMSSVSLANICEVVSYVNVPETTGLHPIFSVKFDVGAETTLKTCINFVRENIHRRLLGEGYEKTVMELYILESRIPVARFELTKNDP